MKNLDDIWWKNIKIVLKMFHGDDAIESKHYLWMNDWVIFGMTE